MEFITDNYIWFIVGGIVVLMTIIGYFAEKTDFGKKKVKEEKERTTGQDSSEKPAKPEKIDKKKLKEEKLAAERARKGELAREKEEAVKKKAEEAKKPVSEITTVPDVKDIVPMEEDLDVPFGDTPKEEVKEESSVLTEDLTAPLSEFTAPSIPVTNEEPVVIPNGDLYAPIGDLEVEQGSVVEPLEEETILPPADIPQNSSNESSDDVWKF